MRVDDLMQHEPRITRAGATLEEAGRTMAEAGCGFLPVLDEGGEVVGVLTDRDVCLALCTRDLLPSETRVAEVMSEGAWTCFAAEDLGTVLQRMAGHRVRRLPVLGGDQRLVGVLSLDDVLALAEGALGATGQPTLSDVASALRVLCGHPLPALREPELREA